MPLRISVPRISAVVPLPGVSELECTGRALLRLLKDSDVEHDKRNVLARRLESLIKHTNELQNVPELLSQLREIQKQFEVVDSSKLRLGVRAAQRKLDMWDELKTRLDETMEVNMLDLLVQTRKEAHARSNEHKTIPSYEITEEVEVSTRTLDDSFIRHFFPSSKTIKKTVRAGRLMKRSVTYLTFATDKDSATHELVEDQMKSVFQLQHVNVAKILGVTQGYSGLNGIVVAMDGIDFDAFMAGTRSGAAWRNCIKGFEAFFEWAPEWTRAERISVTPNGHVTLFPGRSGEVDTRFHTFCHQLKDCELAASLIILIYGVNCKIIPAIRLRTFVEKLVDLGLGFTGPQVMNVAAACGLFPDSSSHDITFGPSPLPNHDPEVGSFCRITYSDGWLRGWELLGRTRHVENTDVSAFFEDSRMEWCAPPTLDGAEWVSYVLHDLSSHYRWMNLRYWRWCSGWGIDEPYRFDWEDIFTEAQKISESLHADLDNIYFVSATFCEVSLTSPQETNWDDIPEIIYYHRNSRSADPYEVEGFCSADQTPDGGAWQEQHKSQGWELKFDFGARAYRMGDGWNRRYERELKDIMAATPGSYPGAEIEEVA